MFVHVISGGLSQGAWGRVFAQASMELRQADDVPRLGRAVRLALVLAALALVGVLVVVRCLTPDPRGFGTHTQLGLLPCTFERLTGRRCPTCGMTTAYAWFARGQLDLAGRPILPGSWRPERLSGLFPGSWRWPRAGRPLGCRTLERPLTLLVVAAVAISLLAWTFRIFFSEGVMTTPRLPARTRRELLGLGLALTGLASLAGCDPCFDVLSSTQRAHGRAQRPEDPPQGQKGCRAHSCHLRGSHFRAVDREVTREFVRILKENVKKIEVVDTAKVWDWAESHPSWSDPSEAARAFEADIAIFLEFEQFQIEILQPRIVQGRFLDSHPGARAEAPDEQEGQGGKLTSPENPRWFMTPWPTPPSPAAGRSPRKPA